ncbi:MAG: hypothetical protein IKI57_00525 [Clostridia bacterium]|nr:hypothetical protein [Clostridia bacterium]
MDNSDGFKLTLSEVVGWWINEFKTQAGHMTCIFALLICFFIEDTRRGVIWSILFALYYIVLAITGKSTFELVWDYKNEAKNNEKKKMFKRIYLISVFSLFIVGAITTGFFVSLLVAIIVGVITFIYYLFDVDSNISTAYEIDYRENNRPINNFIRLTNFSNDHPIIYEGIYYLSMFLMILIPTLYLPCVWWIKMIIIIAYIAVVPFVTLMADNGIDITTIFDFQDY